MKLKAAGPAEIIRCIQKDKQHLNYLSDDFTDLLRVILQNCTSESDGYCLTYQSLCPLIAALTYYGFTSLSRLQTLGEEYTGIIQTDGTNGRVPKLPNRLLQLSALIIQFGGLKFYEKVLQRTISGMRSISTVENSEEAIKLFEGLMRILPIYLQALHKAYFFYYPRKYHLSKRLFNIDYRMIRDWLRNRQQRIALLKGYRLLGLITFVQTIVDLAFNLMDIPQRITTMKTKTQEKSKRMVEEFEVDAKDDATKDLKDQTHTSKTICTLCLEIRSNCSSTPCGHLFCWSCILDWLDEREICPVCKESLQKSNVIQLRNYR